MKTFFKKSKSGVFIIVVDESAVDNISTLTVCRVFQLADDASLDAVTCLLMSDTGLALNWNPSAIEEQDENEGSEDDYRGRYNFF